VSEEYSILPKDKTASNLAFISREQSLLEERRICELYEMISDVIDSAFDLYPDSADIYGLLSLLSDAPLIRCGELHSQRLEVNSARLTEYLRMNSVIDKAILCQLIADRLLELGFSVSEGDFLPEEKAPETFVYVKNSFADEAYDVFSQDFTDPRVRYAENFKDALRLVTEGEVSYCLLPLEERGGTRLHSIDELIFRADLKINSVTPVFGFDGSADMKYALVSGKFSVPPRREGDDRYLEIRIPVSGEVSLGELLSVAEFYKLGIYRVSTVNFDTDEGRCPYYSIVFRDEGHEFSLLLIYLTLFTSSYTPVGVYKNLE